MIDIIVNKRYSQFCSLIFQWQNEKLDLVKRRPQNHHGEQTSILATDYSKIAWNVIGDPQQWGLKQCSAVGHRNVLKSVQTTIGDYFHTHTHSENDCRIANHILKIPKVWVPFLPLPIACSSKGLSGRLYGWHFNFKRVFWVNAF